MTQTAEELHRRAVDASIRGRYALAVRALEDAQTRTHDADLLARIAGTRAVVLHRTGDPDAAERLCREALATRGLSRHTRAILYGQLGALAGYGGRLDAADEWLSRALHNLSDDAVAAARVRMNRSLVSMQRRRLAEAVRDLTEAAEVFAAYDLPTERAHARHNLGYAALLEGDLVSALEAMTAARVAAVTSAVSAAVGDVDRAEVLRDAGLTTDAERILEHAAATFSAHRMRQSSAEAEFQLASSLVSHDPARARRVAASAGRRFRSLGNDAWAARADAVKLRAMLYAGAVGYGGEEVRTVGRTISEDEVDAVASALDRHAFRSEAAALRLSRDLWRVRQRTDPAGRPRSIRVPPSATMQVHLMSHELRAARASAAGRHRQAQRHAAAGLDTLSRWQRSFGSLDLQTSVGMHGAGLVYAGLDAAIRDGKPEVLFEWSERARHLSQQVVPLRPPPDPAWATELAELRMLRATDPTDDWLSDPRATALQDAARQRQWSAMGSAEIQERASLNEVQAGLDGETALVAFIYPGRTLTALVVTRDRTVVLSLGGASGVREMLPGLRADLDMAATVRTGPLASVIQRALDDRLSRLSSALLDEAARVAGVRRLVITAPGVLNGIPWGMLPHMRGRAFTIAVSATRWLHESRRRSTWPIAAGFAAGPRVTRAEEEVDAAASAWPNARTLRGSAATVDAVTEMASQVGLLHVAAHGRHAVDNPLFSGLELDDGTLFGYDIDRMPRVPDTVVLSACEVGRSSVRWGEEAIGMTRIWLHAGTRAVVATPVIVADDVACELLGTMHGYLASGIPAAEALAAASESTGLISPFQTHGAGF